MCKGGQCLGTSKVNFALHLGPSTFFLFCDDISLLSTNIVSKWKKKFEGLEVGNVNLDLGITRAPFSAV